MMAKFTNMKKSLQKFKFLFCYHKWSLIPYYHNPQLMTEKEKKTLKFYKRHCKKCSLESGWNDLLILNIEDFTLQYNHEGFK